MNLLFVVNKLEQKFFSKQNKIYLFNYLFNLFQKNFVLTLFMNGKEEVFSDVEDVWDQWRTV